MDEIAEEADFSVGTLYNFFDNKDALFGQILIKIAEDFLEEVEERILSEPDSLKAISKLILVRLQHAHEHGEFLRIFMESKPLGNINPDNAVPQNCTALYEIYLKKVADLFERAMNEGAIQELDPVYAVLSFEGTINAFFAYWKRQQLSLSLEEQVETVRGNYLNRLITPKDGKQN